MFVFSVKSTQIKLVALILFVVVTAVTLFFLSQETDTLASEPDGLNLNVSTSVERVAFVSQFGWEINEDPTEVCEVIIPQEFDETYSTYNEIQKTQGFDLTKYSSMRVKRWTYQVTNYPGYEGASCIRINILVYEGKVIGGDVCSVELNGFMHSFYFPTSNTTSTVTTTTPK